jgi:hypothetical protein
MAKFIRLFDASQTTVLDSISVEYEDSFCLETFGTLIEVAESTKKHFIIARVQTADPKQPEKTFYSYYHAHQLNKQLFRTQWVSGKRMLHQLHALNPLTNTDMIGSVLYFLVKGKTVVEKMPAVPPAGASASKARSSNTIDAPVSGSLRIDTALKKIHDQEMPPPSPTVSSLPYGIRKPSDLNKALHNREPIPETEEYHLNEGWVMMGGGETEFDESSSQIAEEMHSRERQRAFVPSGTLTQNGIPLSPVEVLEQIPEKLIEKKRPMSFLNATNATDNDFATFETWSGIQENRDAVEEYYDAILFATDSDYLDYKRIRDTFRDNAVDPEDNELIELPSARKRKPQSRPNEPENEAYVDPLSELCIIS